MKSRTLRPFPGIDYGFRPASYFSGADPDTLVLASILGEERRKDVKQRLRSGNSDPLVWGEWLTDSRLDDSDRRLIGGRHPRFMGGEYLPGLGEDEIEIARIVLASVTQDVMSIRARRDRGLIHYRVCDEYDSGFERARRRSKLPLTLGELIGFIDGSNQEGCEVRKGLVMSGIVFHVEFDGDTASMRDFMSVSSSFYEDLGPHYDKTIGTYLDDVDAAQAEAEVEAGSPRSGQLT